MTAKVRADETARKKNGKRAILQTLVEQAPIGMVMLDRAMRHIQVSGRWLNDVASTREKTIGKSHYQDSPATCLLNFTMRTAEASLGETVSGLDDSFMRPDGAVRKVNWRVVPWGDFGEIMLCGIIIYVGCKSIAPGDGTAGATARSGILGLS